MIAPLGPRDVLGVVWKTNGDGKVDAAKLKAGAAAVDVARPALPGLCDFIDW